jgi:A/G-specific adenine glycosylase
MAESLLPAEPAVAARWSVAVMELGALVCTAASPRCAECPVARDCAWLAAGRPPEGPELVRRRAQRYDGTDRQCRGRLLAVLRDGGGPATQAGFEAVWADQAQLARALDGLVADGLVDPLPDGRYALPGAVQPAASLDGTRDSVKPGPRGRGPGFRSPVSRGRRRCRRPGRRRCPRSC